MSDNTSMRIVMDNNNLLAYLRPRIGVVSPPDWQTGIDRICERIVNDFTTLSYGMDCEAYTVERSGSNEWLRTTIIDAPEGWSDTERRSMRLLAEVVARRVLMDIRFIKDAVDLDGREWSEHHA